MSAQDVEKGKKSSRGYIPWDDDMDKALLDTLVEYYNKGDRCQNGWKPHVYTAAIKNVQEKCGVKITKSNIESRSKTFDKHYNIVNGLLSQSGFGWDWEKNRLSIDSEAAWESYVEKNKEAKGYRNKVIKYWESISLVYCKDHANGEAARTASESSREMAKEGGSNKDAAASTTTSGNLKRQRSDDSFNSMWCEKLDMFKTVLQEDAPPKPPPSSEVLAALQQVQGLDSDTELEAYDILTSDARKFESMVALPLHRRKKWVLMQLKK